MQRLSLIIISTFCFVLAQAQLINTSESIPDSASYSNIYVKPIHTDSLQSTFMIWVKKEVKPHFHKYHTEYIQVISGTGIMTLDDSTFVIKQGDAVIIPMGAIHSVITTSEKSLKVISVQAPKFDGDRVWINLDK